MKTEQSRLNFKPIYLAILLGIGILPTLAFCQERVEKSMPFGDNPSIVIDVYELETEIVPSKDNELHVWLDYEISANDSESATKTKEAIEKALLNMVNGEIKISNRFYKSMITNIGTHIELADGTKVSVKSFEFKTCKIAMPAEAKLHISALYSNVKMQFSLKGDLSVSAYDSRMSLKSVDGNATINAKYSKMQTDRVSKDLKLDLYETTFDITKAASTNVMAKFSNTSITNSGNCTFNVYEGSLNIQTAGNVTGESKFTNVKLDSVTSIKANCYEGRLDVNRVQNMDLNVKYLEGNFGSVKKIEITNGYENNFKIEDIEEIKSIGGKFNRVAIKQLNGSVSMSGYEEKLGILGMGKNVSSVVMEGKYGEASINAGSQLGYTLHYESKYGDLKVNNSDFNIKENQNVDDQITMEAIREIGKTNARIEVTGYEMKLNLTNK